MVHRSAVLPTIWCLIVAGSVVPSLAEPDFGLSGLGEGSTQDARPFGQRPCQFTQCDQPDLLEAGVGLACGSSGVTTDNQFIRVFDLDGDHGLVGEVCVEEIEYGVESAAGGVGLSFNVYCVPHGFGEPHTISREELDAGFVHSESGVQPDATLELFSAPLGGCCNAQSHDMAIEIATEDCLESGACQFYYPGGNYGTELNHWFIGAPDCGIVDPIDPGLIGGPGWFPIVLNVTASCSGAEVPASGPVGLVAMLLLVGCGGAYALRRQRLG